MVTLVTKGLPPFFLSHPVAQVYYCYTKTRNFTVVCILPHSHPTPHKNVSKIRRSYIVKLKCDQPNLD